MTPDQALQQKAREAAEHVFGLLARHDEPGGPVDTAAKAIANVFREHVQSLQERAEKAEAENADKDQRIDDLVRCLRGYVPSLPQREAIYDIVDREHYVETYLALEEVMDCYEWPKMVPAVTALKSALQAAEQARDAAQQRVAELEKAFGPLADNGMTWDELARAREVLLSAPGAPPRAGEK